MELPDDILHLIRGFAKPIGTRLDWRTCKVAESNIILYHNRYTLNLCWYTYMETMAMVQEILTWTLYGRRRAIRCMISGFPLMGDWYEDRIRDGNPIL